MVIYGWNTKVLKDAPFAGHQCTNCGHESAHIIVSASYAHIFWIPVFPYKKVLHLVCDNCQHANKPKEVSPEVRALAKGLKSSVRFPFYMFSGVAIIMALVAYFAVETYMDEQRFEKYLTEPEVNDIYYLYDKDEPTEYKYSLLKVIDIREDSIDVSPNSFGYNYEPAVLMEDDGFYDVYFTYHIDQLREMHKTDELKSVVRLGSETMGMDRVITYNPEDFENK
ncbi:hypothetical protein BFP97_12220 [Roseivirga sp. 4D4]|uniref:hypothetical protein n=1 Tax=Roseivirga sp. 4D4 TaxID=1889784 RepID=UPI00085332BF|nr:hypothetical protein [Roseivirga sp. 4D4]OEK02234.1 hypothetical protein BFP97_12220 [Roseivirga sp. 4D4]